MRTDMRPVSLEELLALPPGSSVWSQLDVLFGTRRLARATDVQASVVVETMIANAEPAVARFALKTLLWVFPSESARGVALASARSELKPIVTNPGARGARSSSSDLTGRYGNLWVERGQDRLLIASPVPHATAWLTMDLGDARVRRLGLDEIAASSVQALLFLRGFDRDDYGPWTPHSLDAGPSGDWIDAALRRAIDADFTK